MPANVSYYYMVMAITYFPEVAMVYATEHLFPNVAELTSHGKAWSHSTQQYTPRRCQ